MRDLSKYGFDGTHEELIAQAGEIISTGRIPEFMELMKDFWYMAEIGASAFDSVQAAPADLKAMREFMQLVFRTSANYANQLEHLERQAGG